MPRTWASVLAVAIPTRIPVNSPGPSPTPIPVREGGSSSAHPSSRFTAGTTASWFARGAEIRADATGPCSLARATVVCGVEVSIPRMSTSDPPRGGQLEDAGPPEPPRGTATGEADLPPFVPVRERQLHLEMAVGQQALDGVTPFHEDHGVALDHLLEPEIQHVLHPIEAVDVQMVDGIVSTVLPNPGDGGRDHWVAHAEAPG